MRMEGRFWLFVEMRRLFWVFGCLLERELEQYSHC